MTDDQHPDDSAADRPATHGDPGMPAAGRRPADREQPPAASGAEGSPPSGADDEALLDPRAPLAADGPTIRLSKAGLMPPGDTGTNPAADAGATGGERPGTAADEPTVGSPPARDDEATTLLTPPAAPDGDGPASRDAEPVEAQDETIVPASHDGGSTMRLQPPFFAPGTTRTPRAKPVPDEAPAGPLDDAVESRERWGSSPAGQGSWMDSPAWPDDRTGAGDAGADRDTPERWQDNLARAAAAADERTAREAPEHGARRPATDDAIPPAGPDEAGPGAGSVSAASWPGDARSGPGDLGDATGPGPDHDRSRAAKAATGSGSDLAGPRAAEAATGSGSDLAGPRAAEPATRSGPDLDGPRAAKAAAGSGHDLEGSRAAEPATGSGRDGGGPGAAGAAGSGARSGVPVGSPDAVTGPGGGAGGVPGKVAPWRRLSSAGALIWVLLALLGFTLVVQLQSNDDDAGLATARQEDLVGILSDLEARDQRLQQEINALEESQRQLTSGVAGRQAALAEAGKRADELGLLSGTLPARGPGLKITIDPKGAPIKASAILNAVQELRGAGGEVMEIIGDNGVAVRIVASSYFVDAGGGQVIVDGKQLSGPYTVWVIGVPATMQTALQIPGGVVASVSQAGGNVTMEQRTTVEVTAVRQPTSLQYARPVS